MSLLKLKEVIYFNKIPLFHRQGHPNLVSVNISQSHIANEWQVWEEFSGHYMLKGKRLN